MIDLERVISAIKAEPITIDKVLECFPDDFEISQISSEDQFRILKEAALSKNFEEVLTTLKNKGFDLAMESARRTVRTEAYGSGFFTMEAEETHYGGETLLHIAAINNRAALANFLIIQGVSIDAKDGPGCTPLARAQEHKHAEFIATLKEHVAAPTKINRAQFQDLVIGALRQGETNINVAAMLDAKGYSTNLNNLIIDDSIFRGFKCDRLNFSGTSLVGAQFATWGREKDEPVPARGSLPKLMLQNCNLKDAKINKAWVLETSDCLKGSNVDGLNAVATTAAAKEAQNFANSKVFLIERGRDFDQYYFLQKLDPEGKTLNKEGNCYGLCVEYVRYFLKDGHDNAVGKFYRKIDNKAENFTKRVSGYQKHLQGEIKKNSLLEVSIMMK